MNLEKFAVPIAILIAGSLMAGALYISNIKSNSSAKNTTNTETSLGKIRKITSNDHILGNPNAKLLIVEYSDTECPYCKMFHNTMHKIVSEYGSNGDVAWVYRHFPIDQLHPKSRKEAEATECANEIGGPAKFWEYINMVYEKTPANDGLDPAQLPIFARAIGINVDTFNSCLSSSKYAKKVEADYEDGIATGGVGTPHTILVSQDGTQTPLEGAYPYSQLKTIINTALNK